MGLTRYKTAVLLHFILFNITSMRIIIQTIVMTCSLTKVMQKICK